MAANLATKEEFTVGWGFHLNNKNTVASQNYRGSENLTDQKMVLTPLTTLTTAQYVAQTLVLSGFQGGATRKTRSTSAFQSTRSVLLHRETAKKVQSTPITSSRSGLRAEARARSARVDAETETVSFRWRRNGAVYREQPSTTGADKNFRLAGSQTKIRHKLKACEKLYRPLKGELLDRKKTISTYQNYKRKKGKNL